MKRLLITCLLLAGFTSAQQSLFTWVTNGSTIAISSYVGTTNKNVIIPDTINGMDVTQLGINATETGAIFRDKTVVTNVVLPVNLITIKGYSFIRASGLRSINLPDQLTSVDFFAFYQCTSLKYINLPIHLYDLGQCIFESCSSLEGITIPPNSLPPHIDNIPESFMLFTAITNLTIPDNVENIGFRSFAGCSNLTKVIIGTGVTNIAGSFWWNGSLTNVTFYGNAPTFIRDGTDVGVFNGAGLVTDQESGDAAADYGGITSCPATAFVLQGTTGWPFNIPSITSADYLNHYDYTYNDIPVTCLGIPVSYFTLPSTNTPSTNTPSTHIRYLGKRQHGYILN